MAVLRRSVRPAGWVLAVILFATASVDACAAASQTQTEAACCAAMAHACGAMAITTPCCTGSGHTERGLIAAGIAKTLVAPSLSFVLTHALAGLDTPAQGLAAFRRVQIRPPGVPTYLLVSSLRI